MALRAPITVHSYWNEDEIAEALRNGQPIACIYSNQFSRLRPRDTIWIFGPYRERFVTIGYVRVAELRRHADGKVEAVAGDPVTPRIVDLTDDWADELTFYRQENALTAAKHGLPNGQQLQTVRDLSVAARKWLERRWSTG